ncbi:MAG: hypothetical protein M3O61_00725 [Gemmatimonadota bacterium]|nr:hypothetical protein [Gemmatimonadota bacterium]
MSFTAVSQCVHEDIGQTRRNYLVRDRRRRGHEQHALQQLVTVPVVREIVEHVDRELWNRQRHTHSLIPRRVPSQVAIGQDGATPLEPSHPLSDGKVYRGGWIVLASGEQRGSVKTGPTITATPTLNTSSGTVTLSAGTLSASLNRYIDPVTDI